LNVLKGEMSLVGPRPHALAHDNEYAGIIEGYSVRQRVLPGITGWAQVNGCRGETETPEKMRQRVEHDLYYVENWSPLFDLKILALTARTLLDPRNTY
jgi:lipopolysaccharide/colanic/teichoic acid biosynthesis glycosyltransferase